MFGYSEWIEFIRRLLKSARTSGCIVISEISGHTNDATGPLHCPARSIQEDRFPARRGRGSEQNGLSSIHIKNGHEGNPVCVCVCKVGPWLGPAYRASKDSSLCREFQGGLHLAVRSQTYTFTINLTGPQGERNKARSESKNNPFFWYPNTILSLACGWVFCCLTVTGVYSRPT